MAASILFIQSWLTINPDVSFLTWTASQLMGSPEFGVDIYEVNLPLAFMIYAPAAWFAPWMGFDLALKLWLTAVACLSVAMFWLTCDERLRFALTLTLVLLITFLLPKTFGEREQIAFMLTAPYVAGPSRYRSGAIISGLMAGVGFSIKPYFLIPLGLILLTRRRLSTEEWIIAATGAIYAVVLLLFFRPYLFDFLPLAHATYWAFQIADATAIWIVASIILLSAMPLSLAGARQPTARGFVTATFGFTIAALVQYKGFDYHFLAAWGFLTLFLVARTFNERRIIAICASIELVAIIFLLGPATLDIAKPTDEQRVMSQLLPDIDRSPSFLSYSTDHLPGFPTALYTKSEYMGMAMAPIFLGAARAPVGGPELQEKARQLAISQAVRELQRKPALVIVDRPDTSSGWDRREFDLLSFFLADKQFRQLWADYRYEKTIGIYQLYVRR